MVQLSPKTFDQEFAYAQTKRKRATNGDLRDSIRIRALDPHFVPYTVSDMNLKGVNYFDENHICTKIGSTKFVDAILLLKNRPFFHTICLDYIRVPGEFSVTMYPYTFWKTQLLELFHKGSIGLGTDVFVPAFPHVIKLIVQVIQEMARDKHKKISFLLSSVDPTQNPLWNATAKARSLLLSINDRYDNQSFEEAMAEYRLQDIMFKLSFQLIEG
jgi:hypothetical protein